MGCDGVYATAQAFADFWGLSDVCHEKKDEMESVLDLSATDIHAALASVGACDCTLASWGAAYLEKLNIINAIGYYIKLCGSPIISADQRRMYFEWANSAFKGISEGTVDVCDGATGSGFPAMGSAQQSVTDFNAAQIIVNDLMRNSGG